MQKFAEHSHKLGKNAPPYLEHFTELRFTNLASKLALAGQRVPYLTSEEDPMSHFMGT